MKNNKQSNESNEMEAVVGVFDDLATANRAARQLRGSGTRLQRVSRKDTTAKDQVPEIVYDEIAGVEESDIVRGMAKGGAIGAGSGLLLIGMPVLNVIAPIAGALVGAWIGGIAAIDEAERAIELPDPRDYRQLLKKGKSLIVLPGDESTRIGYAAELDRLGATNVHQHPPVLEASFHKRKSE